MSDAIEDASPLKPRGARRFGLSKSRIAAFEQCHKRLWLAVHRPELAQADEASQARFDTGHQVGALACSLLPDGVMIGAEEGLASAVETTRALIRQTPRRPLFEATLEHDGVLVRIDILEPVGARGWIMAEVKSSTSDKAYHLGDLATQLWVARGARLKIERASIRHLNTQFVLEREGDYRGLLVDADLTQAAEPIVAQRPSLVASARAVLAGREPAIEPGVHCDAPFACEFKDHCTPARPPEPQWPVTVLPNGCGKRWLEAGIDNLFEVEAEALTTPMHRRVHRATTTGDVFHDVEGARTAIAAWPFPRTWLDFETIAFAAPRWIGTRPYQQIPFQFSAHIEQKSGKIEHVGFLSLDGGDPRRACAEALVRSLPKRGAVIGYNARFERDRILDLADAFPDLAKPLRKLADRIVDLLPVVRACWYHRDQRGSWSIKAVLPTIAPELDYGSLAVSDGMAAQEAYLEAIAAGTSAERVSALRIGLEDYCARDTQAMYLISKRLTQCDEGQIQ